MPHSRFFIQVSPPRRHLLHQLARAAAGLLADACLDARCSVELAEQRRTRAGDSDRAVASGLKQHRDGDSADATAFLKQGGVISLEQGTALLGLVRPGCRTSRTRRR